MYIFDYPEYKWKHDWIFIGIVFFFYFLTFIIQIFLIAIIAVGLFLISVSYMLGLRIYYYYVRSARIRKAKSGETDFLKYQNNFTVYPEIDDLNPSYGNSKSDEYRQSLVAIGFLGVHQLKEVDAVDGKIVDKIELFDEMEKEVAPSLFYLVGITKNLEVKPIVPKQFIKKYRKVELTRQMQLLWDNLISIYPQMYLLENYQLEEKQFLLSLSAEGILEESILSELKKYHEGKLIHYKDSQ